MLGGSGKRAHLRGSEHDGQRETVGKSYLHSKPVKVERVVVEEKVVVLWNEIYLLQQEIVKRVLAAGARCVRIAERHQTP